ncbi:MAG: putative Histidine kinase, contains GAF domain [Nitrospira sp.]|jgi:signal transduction histidine kinase
MEIIRLVGDFAETLGAARDLSRLGNPIVRTLSQHTRLQEAAVWIRESEDGQYRLLASHGHSDFSSLPPALTSDHPLVTGLSGKPYMFHDDHKPSSPVGLAMTAVRATLCLALRNKGRLLGLCTLGPVNTDTRLDEDAMVLGETIARIAGNSLDHLLTQNDLRRSSTLMRRTDRLRSLEIMAGGFAHEIRNPLTSIKTFVQLAPQRQQDPVFINEFSKLALEDIHRIERLLHEILDYASYMTPHPTEVDLNELVASCIGFVSSSAAHRGIQLQTHLAPQLPPLSLDRQQIKQVLLNLLLNALDAMPNGHGIIQIHTHLLSQAGNPPWVQLQVKDEGCGIPPDHLEHIFDPFFSTKHSNSASDGAGLGLTTAHQIVREHGGAITVESRVGAGSTFSVNLPVQDTCPTVSAARE